MSDFHQLVENAYKDKQLSQTCYESLIKRELSDDADEHFSELIYAIEHANYYKILDRIDRGYEKIAAEPEKKSQHSKLLNELIKELERVKPA